MKVKNIIKIIGIILLLVIVLLLIHTIRNFIIIKSFQKKLSKYESSSNYHIESVAKESENVTMTVNYYKKDNRQATFMERKTAEETIKIAMYDNGERVDVFTDNENEKTFRVNASNGLMSIEIVNYFHTDSNWQTFLISIFTKIKKINYNNKECYDITNLKSPELLYDKEKNEMYIEKETGLCIKSVMGSSIAERKYEFDNVEDTIFSEPDISQYKILENN